MDTNDSAHAPISSAGRTAPSGAAMDRRVERPKPRLKPQWIALGAAALALLVLAVLLVPPPGSMAVKAADVETATAVQAPFRDYLPVRAEVAPLRTVIVGAVSGGQVESVIATDGALVAAGAPLASLSNQQLKLEVTAREAEIGSGLGSVSAQQLSLEKNRIDRDREIAETNYNLLKAQRELDIRRRLHDQGFVSDAGVKTFADEAGYYRSRLEALKTAQSAENRISGAEARQIQATGARLRNNLSVVQSALESLVLRAPVAGRLTNFTLQPGQTLKPGDPVGQIDSEGAYKLTADIDEFYLGRVSPGQKGTAELDGVTIPVEVSRVLPQVNAGRFRAELTLGAQPSSPLRRGQTLDVRLTLGQTKPALVLPNGPWLQASGGSYAFVLEGRSARRRPITVGRRNPEQVEVTSGLKPGERVLTSDYAPYAKTNRLVIR